VRARRYPLLVFDWDGTLLDSIASIVACTRATLAEIGLPRVDDAHIRAAIGTGLRETVEGLAPGCDDRLFERICDVYRRLWFDGYSAEPLLFAGAEPALAELRGRGHRMAIATAKSRRGLATDLEKTGLGGYFEAIRTLDDAPGKPHPGMLLEILDETGVRDAEALMIGDSLHDLGMAANAGVDAVAVASGSQPREILLGAEPLACLESVRDLPAWLRAE